MRKARLIAWTLLMLSLRLARASPETSLQESSDSYLRNVVSELQILNGVLPAVDADASSSAIVSSTSAPGHTVRFFDTVAEGQQHQQVLALPNYELQSQVVPNNPVYFDNSAARKPLPLGFSATELAAMYRKAIERGTPVKYNSLLDMISQYTPKFTSSQFELPDLSPPRPQSADSEYAYYFYPLQTFNHELANHGYKTLPNFKFDASPAESTKKETSSMNPVLIGISSFLGMALLFMLSLFFYPRFMHYMHFPFVTTSRTAFENEFGHLAIFVIEAIDHYNKSHQKKSKRSPSHLHVKNYQVHQKR